MKKEVCSLAEVWLPATVHLHQWSATLRRFRSICVERHSRHADGLAYGKALWGAADSGQPMALCWDWSELSPGVVALANPLRVLSNVTLLSSDGLRLGERLTLLELNGAVHSLNWQTEVCELLSSGGKRHVGRVGVPEGRLIGRRSESARSRQLLAA